ncbi:MAG: hypothetical protein NXI24_12050 [bacterium]|nr:hypothetical protein [bacterium]
MQTRNRITGNFHGSRQAMHLARLAIAGIIFAIAFVSPGRAQAEPDKKYLPRGVLDYGEVESREAVADFGALHPVLRRFAPPKSEFDLDAAAGGVVTGLRGTRLSIPPNAFVTKTGAQVKGRVTIVLREVIDAFDFLVAPIGLEYTENGRREWFQSGGMFHVQATKGGDELILAPNQKIIVHFPNVQPGDFQIYRTNADGAWVRRGEAARTTSPDAEDAIVPAGDETFLDGEGEGEWVNPEMAAVGAHIFAIDGMSWWNFDEPYPHVACVKGTLSDPDGVFAGDFQVFSIGLDYRGAFSRWSSGTEFKINVHKDRQAKILIIDRKGNVGVSPVLATPRRSGFDANPEGPQNFCQKIDPIPIRKVEPDLLKDRRAFMNYLGLQPESYGVNYGEPAG